MMDKALYDAHRALGTKMTPPMVGATCDLAAARLIPGLGDGIAITRDIAYGSHDRHRIDLFMADGTAGSDAALRPVVLFVHGGGFVGGDRTMMPGLPFYDNIGLWAARAGYVGATMSYRLAPDHGWPAGAEDVGAAIAWLRSHAADHGGDPARLYLVGQSAGAVHIADYLARPESAGDAAASLAGAVLLSCIYDVGTAERNRMQSAYFGADAGQWGTMAALPGLLATPVPLLCAVAEFDIPDFQAQAAQFAAAWQSARGDYPPLLRLSGHNHLSTILQLGGTGDTLGPELDLFIARTTTPPPA